MRLVDFFGNLSVPDVFIKNQMFIYFDVLNVPPGHLLGTDFNYFLKVGTNYEGTHSRVHTRVVLHNRQSCPL